MLGSILSSYINRLNYNVRRFVARIADTQVLQNEANFSFLFSLIKSVASEGASN
jgi:hypothetical protein